MPGTGARRKGSRRAERQFRAVATSECGSIQRRERFLDDPVQWRREVETGRGRSGV
jgi:hypothetical protein